MCVLFTTLNCLPALWWVLGKHRLQYQNNLRRVEKNVLQVMIDITSQDHPSWAEGRWFRTLELPYACWEWNGFGLWTQNCGNPSTDNHSRAFSGIDPPGLVPAPECLESYRIWPPGQRELHALLLIEKLQLECPCFCYFLASVYITSGQQ